MGVFELLDEHYNMQQGGTWEKQQARVKAEKDAKLKLLLQDKDFLNNLKEQSKNKEVNLKASDATKVVTKNRPELTSKIARNKTDKEIAQEREAKIQDSMRYQNIPFTKDNWREVLAGETKAIGDKLRVSNEPNFFDDYVNPAAMIGNMASNLGQAPLQAQQSDSYMPYVTSVGTPLAMGALAGLGANSTGQFVNNLANPLAGTGDLAKGLYNKATTSLENAGIRTSVSPEVRQGLRTNGFSLKPELFDLNTVRKPSGSIGNQGATPEGANSILESLGIKVKGSNPNEVTLKEMVEHLKNNPKDAEKYQKFLENNPISVNELPGGEFQINDGHHRATLSYYSGKEKIPTIIKNKGEYTTQNESNNFNSEIDWSKWNKEIPENSELMKEYNAIEQTSKADGTWMKNPDGSAFQGTPEQFVQQNSENFKKAFPDGAEKAYRGSYNGLDNTDLIAKFHPEGRGIFTGDLETAKHYTGNGKLNELYHPTSKNSYDIDVKGMSWREVPIENLPGMQSQKTLMGKPIADTDDIATWVENNNVDYVNMRNIFDGVDAKFSRIVNFKPGNYLKSAIGNNGMFDMSNPNIYKAVAPISLGAAYLGTQEQEEPKKFQQGGKFTENENKFLEELAQLKLI
jgi:hypothetical protein